MARASTSFALAGALLVALSLGGPRPAPGQADAPRAVVQDLQESFWQAYNRCDHAATRELFTEDVEFYHDQGGPTLGREALLASIRDNLCGNPAFRVRREEVAGTVRWSWLHKEGVLYGAIVSGEHLFYLTQPGKAEALDGRARFTHLWLLKDGRFRMARILSFDHGPATP